MGVNTNSAWRIYRPAAICRMDKELIQAIADRRDGLAILAASCVTVLVGSLFYGVAFGAWLSARQALYAAVKMPLLIFSVTLANAMINGMLANVLGARLSFGQVCLCILLSLAIASALLGALSPIALFFALQGPSPDRANAMAACRVLLAMHTAAVGACGILGNMRLYRMLRQLTGSRAVSNRVLASWILVSGLVGCQLSWLLSPFLGRPDVPVPFFNPNAFTSNFFEYLWKMISGRAMGCI